MIDLMNMTFMMMKKKKFKFQVKFEVEELSSVPFVSGILFAKVRLLDGGSFTALSSREEVNNHQVRWGTDLKFLCKMTASANTGVLEPCVCRVSVRKELKGGRSYQKLGFADVNLAEFAGAGQTSRRYLLQGYDSKRRLDNSTLKVNIDTSLISGDVLFKAPSSQRTHSSSISIADSPGEGLQLENKGEDCSEDSLASGSSSGFSSLPRTSARPSLKSTESGVTDSEKLKAEVEKGHTRNGSGISEQSKASGYSSCPSHHGHSRQNSLGTEPGHHRSPSTCSAAYSDGNRTTERRRKLDEQRRVDQTRIDADQLIDELIENTDFHVDENAETSGLQLFVAKDGTTALGSQQLRTDSRKYEQVVFNPR